MAHGPGPRRCAMRCRTAGWWTCPAARSPAGAVGGVPAGEVAGRAFHVAAILGEPALWAEAREAMRRGRPRLMWLHARRAWLGGLSRRVGSRLAAGEHCQE